MDLDSLELSTDSAELRSVEKIIQAESTVIFHLSQACKSNNIVCKEVLDMVTAGGSAPEILLTPFCLFLALSMISVKHCQAKVLSGLRTAIMKAIFIEDSRQDNEWLRIEDVMKTKAPDVGDLFSTVISHCRQAGGWDLIVGGLQSLSMELLDVTPRTRAELSRVKTLHNIGGRLLIKLIKKMPDLVGDVLPMLINKILLSPNSLQYTEALRILVSDCSCASILMERHQCLTPLLDNLSRLSYNIARRSLLALLPLFKLSKGTRDSLIMVLRNLLFSPKVSSRQAATAGVLLMLRTVRIPGSKCLSQTMSQSSGSLSQIAVDVHRGRGSLTNESFCLELLGALRRCFSQQCQVKVVLYSGIIDTINSNSQLCEGAVDLLYSHLLTLWGTEGSSRHRWQVKLDKIFKDAEEHWVLEEPLGWFMSCVQQIVGKAQQVLGDDNEILAKIVGLLDEMVENYGKCEAGELGFDEYDSFDRKTSVGAKKCCQVEQLQGLLESLMEYTFTRGADQDEGKARQLVGLFKVHQSLSSVVEASEKRMKTKKGEKQKKGGKKDKEKEKEQASTSLDNTDTEFECPPSVDYTPPLHCITLKSLSLMLKTLLSDRTEDNQPAILILRSNFEFSCFIFETLEKKLQQISENLKINGDEEKTSNPEFRYLTSICQTLYRHSILSREPVQMALSKTTFLLEKSLSILLTHYSRRKHLALACLTRDDPDPATRESLNTLILPALKPLQDKIELYRGRLEDPDEEDVPVKMALCVEILRTLFEQMTDGEGLQEAVDVVTKLKSDLPDDVYVLKPVLSLILFMKTKIDSSGINGYLRDLCKRLHYLAGDLDETVVLQMHQKYCWLVDDNKYEVLPIIFTCLEKNLNQVETVLMWIKSVSSYSVTSEESIAKTERSLCLNLAHQINSFSELVKTALPLDATDGLIRLLSRLYTLIGSLTKHFLNRVKMDKTRVSRAKFAAVISHMDKNLSKHVHSLQKYIEESKEQKEKEKEEGDKKKAKRKAVDPNQAGLKIIKDSKGLTNLIHKMEMMYMDLTKLGKRLGEKLIDGYKFHNRDFKFKMEKLRESESDEDDESGEDENNEDQSQDISGNPTPVHQSTAMADLTNSGRETGQNEPPAKKKRKLYSSANLLAKSS